VAYSYNARYSWRLRTDSVIPIDLNPVLQVTLSLASTTSRQTNDYEGGGVKRKCGVLTGF
jgi:hypothetical protein